MKYLLFAVFLLSSCAGRQLTALEEMELKWWNDRLVSWLEVKKLRSDYEMIDDIFKTDLPDSHPAGVAIYLQLDLSLEGLKIAKRDPDNIGQLRGAKFPDRAQPRHPEGQEYLAFMKSQATKWANNEISWDEVNYRIIAKANEINDRIKAQEADRAARNELGEQTRILRERRSAPPPLTNFGGYQSGGMSFLCRDAIQKGNRGGIFVHC
jgi:hypothetical protein